MVAEPRGNPEALLMVSRIRRLAVEAYLVGVSVAFTIRSLLP